MHHGGHGEQWLCNSRGYMHCIDIRMVGMRQQQISDFSYISTKQQQTMVEYDGSGWHPLTWIAFPTASVVTSYLKLLYEH